MAQFLGSRRLEVLNIDALRVDSGEHVANGAVFAARVHRLKHHEDLVLVLSPEELLEFGKTRTQCLEVGATRGLVSRERGMVIWVPFAEIHLLVRRDSISVHLLLQELVCGHVNAPRCGERI